MFSLCQNDNQGSVKDMFISLINEKYFFWVLVMVSEKPKWTKNHNKEF